MSKNRPVRLLRITTVPMSLQYLLGGQLHYFKYTRGYDVMAVSADGPEVRSIRESGIDHVVVPMTRAITPFQDLVCLLRLIRIIIRFKPDIVHTHTPKAGLLGMIAAWICRVPVRMHTVAGLPLMETKGLVFRLLYLTEKMTYASATNVLVNSAQLLRYIQETLHARSNKFAVLGKGSSNGIDTNYFQATVALTAEAETIRIKNKISPDAIVFSYVGRIVRDKGIHELIEAFKKFSYESSGTYFLLLVGSFERGRDTISQDDLDFLTNHDHVILAGFQPDIRSWLLASDIFVFPSYREGFPNVVMQASCMELPMVASNINGCNEIIEDTKTGLLVPAKDADALYTAMKHLVAMSNRKALGVAARKKVVADYDQATFWNTLDEVYHQELRKYYGI